MSSGFEKITGNHVLVKEYFTEKVSAGGIVIPDAHAEKEQHASIAAQVVALGPFAFEEEREGGHDHPQPGDRVVIERYSGRFVTGNDGARYRIVKDGDVLCVCNGEWDIRVHL